jgi:photosystem II stability/assembly factor-like uncharacterized protein
MAQRATRIFSGAGHWVENDKRFPGGLFRTSPGEGKWQALSRGLPQNLEVRAIAVHPREPDVIYAGTDDGPYRSTDGGDRWERLGIPQRAGTVWSFAFHPGRPQTMYAGLAPVALYRSEDGGDTWKALPGARSPEHCPMGFPTRLVRIAVDPSDPDVIYAALEVSGLLRSGDGGETWEDLSAPLVKFADDPRLKSRIGTDNDAEGMLDSHAVAVSTASSGTVFLAVRMGLFRSDDDGASWRDAEIGRFSPLTYCRDVVVSPHDPRVMYACLSRSARSDVGSLYRSEDIGQSWRRFDHGVDVRMTMMVVAPHPRDSDRIYCTTRGGQVFGTEDGGGSWHEYRLPEGVHEVYALACT